MINTIRPAIPGDENEVAKIHVASWKTTYAGLIPDSFLRSLSIEQKTQSWKLSVEKNAENSRQQILLVSVSPDQQIEGFLIGGLARNQENQILAEVYAIYIDPEKQKRGIGRALFSSFAEWMASHEYRKLKLWVLEGNPAAHFYEKMGGRYLNESEIVEFDGRKCQHLAYGWDDISHLIK